MERRQDKRVGKPGVIESFNFHSTDQDIVINTPLEISLEDISLGGLGVKSNVKLELETTLSINLLLEGMNYVVIGKVMWCKKAGDLYTCGLKLIYLPHELTEFISVKINHENKYTN